MTARLGSLLGRRLVGLVGLVELLCATGAEARLADQRVELSPRLFRHPFLPLGGFAETLLLFHNF